MHTEANNEVLLQEVGPRDGLQNEPHVLPIETRVKLVEDLAATGLKRIQIGSFVSPRRVPQMAGTDMLWRQLTKKPGVTYSVLVLNTRGLDLALAEGIPHIEVYVSASETHSMKNSGVSVEDALESAAAMIEAASARDVGVTAGVMCAFGCFYEGPVPVDRVMRIIARLQERGPSEIGLADTSGMADPAAIRNMIRAVAEKIHLDRITLHLHDTRSLGIQNMIAALELGVRRFDTAVGGLGGCPFIPGAPGNISTERAIEALHARDFVTGVDVDKINSISARTKRDLMYSS